MFLHFNLKKIFLILSLISFSAYSNEGNKCEKDFTPKSLEDRIRSAHIAKFNTINEGSNTQTDSSRSALKNRVRAATRAVADVARRVTPSEESRKKASEAVISSSKAVGERAGRLGMATAEKVDGAITSGVNALETGVRATGRVVVDTAKRVTPSEESRKKASEAVISSGKAVGERAGRLGMATAEKVDGAIILSVNALETGARATGRVVVDTARRVTPSEESRKKASETVRGAVSSAREKFQSSAEQAREQQVRIKEESRTRHSVRQVEVEKTNTLLVMQVGSYLFPRLGLGSAGEPFDIEKLRQVVQLLGIKSTQDYQNFIDGRKVLINTLAIHVYDIQSLTQKSREDLLKMSGMNENSVYWLEQILARDNLSLRTPFVNHLFGLQESVLSSVRGVFRGSKEPESQEIFDPVPINQLEESELQYVEIPSWSVVADWYREQYGNEKEGEFFDFVFGPNSSKAETDKAIGEFLSKPIEDLNSNKTIVPLRALNALKRANIYTIDSLVRKTRKDLLDEKDIGPRSVDLFEEALALRGVSLGMADTK